MQQQGLRTLTLHGPKMLHPEKSSVVRYTGDRIYWRFSRRTEQIEQIPPKRIGKYGLGIGLDRRTRAVTRSDCRCCNCVARLILLV